MSQFQIEIQLIAAMVSVACALPGVFLALRGMSLMSDAISHSILLGIVIAFAFVKTLGSPLLLIGASLCGMAVVLLVEALKKSGLVKEDAAIGLVFPLFFSIGVILITRNFADVHLDVDAVLLGELAFAPLDRLRWGGADIGPRALYLTGGILLLNILFFTIFYKELKLTAFDPGLAAALGFSPAIFNHALLTSVSITAVGAFDAVGSILVAALMIAPPAAALLLTDRLHMTMLTSAALALASAAGGYWASHWLNVSIAGSIATVTGIFFLLAFLFAPERGMVALWRHRAGRRARFAQLMMLIHLLHHAESPEQRDECALDAIHVHLGWEKAVAEQTAKLLIKRDLAALADGVLNLTSSGRALAEKSMVV